MIVLVDLDSVTADFELGFYNELVKQHPEIKAIPIEQRSTFKVREQYCPLYGPDFRQVIKKIETAPGFFLSLPPLPGSIEAILEISRKNEVFFCSAPLKEYKYCAPEKIEWVGNQLGSEWTKRVILTHDKTLCIGDKLIDDKPEIIGVNKNPTWEHVLVDWLYNRHVAGKRRINYDWSNWKEVLPELL
jgi:5'-nucleotidase